MKVAKYALGNCIDELQAPSQILILPHFTIVNRIFEEPFLSHSLRLCPASQGFQGTGRPTRRLIVPLSRVKEKFLSRDKKVLPVPLSLCHRTKAGANVPEQNPLSRVIPGQNKFQNFKKKMTIFPGLNKIEGTPTLKLAMVKR